MQTARRGIVASWRRGNKEGIPGTLSDRHGMCRIGFNVLCRSDLSRNNTCFVCRVGCRIALNSLLARGQLTGMFSGVAPFVSVPVGPAPGMPLPASYAYRRCGA